MATEAEIRARAMQEFQMAVEICQIRRDRHPAGQNRSLERGAGRAWRRWRSTARPSARRTRRRRLSTRRRSTPVTSPRSTRTPSTATPTWR